MFQISVDYCLWCYCVLPIGWAALNWQSICSSKTTKSSTAHLASWMGFRRTAGVAAGNLQECVTRSKGTVSLAVSNLRLDLLSCNMQQWPQQTRCDGMWFVGCCNRSAGLIVLFVITYLCSGFTCIAGSSYVGKLLSLAAFNSRFVFCLQSPRELLLLINILLEIKKPYGNVIYRCFQDIYTN